MGILSSAAGDGSVFLYDYFSIRDYNTVSLSSLDNEKARVFCDWGKRRTVELRFHTQNSLLSFPL